MKYLFFLFAVIAMLPLQQPGSAQSQTQDKVHVFSETSASLSTDINNAPDYVLIQAAQAHRTTLQISTADPTPGPSNSLLRPAVLHPMSFDGFDTASGSEFSLHRIVFSTPLGDPSAHLTAGFDTHLVYRKYYDGFTWGENHRHFLVKRFHYLNEPSGYAMNIRLARLLLPSLQFSMSLNNAARPNLNNYRAPAEVQFGLQWSRRVTHFCTLDSDLEEVAGKNWVTSGALWRLSHGMELQTWWDHGHSWLGLDMNLTRSASMNVSYRRRTTYMNFYTTF